MYVCVCVCVLICVSVYVCTSVRVCVHVCVCTHRMGFQVSLAKNLSKSFDVCACVRVFCVYVCVCVCVCVCMCVCVCTHRMAFRVSLAQNVSECLSIEPERVRVVALCAGRWVCERESEYVSVCVWQLN